MARTDFDIQVAGLKELVAGLHDLQGKGLERVVADSIGRTVRGVVVPAMRRQMSADFRRRGSHAGKVKPARGQSGPAERNVTARKTRRRSGELVAIGVGPRAWYSHFPIAGTRAHVITARGIGGRADSRTVRAINRGSADRARSLYIRGAFATRVQHPGSGGTDSIRKAVQGIAPAVSARYASDLQKAYDRIITGPVRRARPKPPG